jgi:hypothetical protein
MRKTVLALLVLVMLFISGCMSYSEHPIAEANKTDKVDVPLLGTWYWKDKSEDGYFHIGLDKETNLLKLMMVEIKKDGKMNTAELVGHTTELAGNKYLNLKWKTPKDDKSKGYMFIKYDIAVDGQKLGLAFADIDIYKDALDQKSLKGELVPGKWFSSVKITQDSQGIREFIAKGGDKLFPKTKYIKKLRLKKYKVK